MFFILIFICLFVETFGQTCRNATIYARCSTNVDCGCLPFSSADDSTGVCAFLHLNVSKMNFCHSKTYYCDQPSTVCVHHPNLSTNRSLCYPTGMISTDLCPPLLLFNLTNSSVEQPCTNITWAKRGILIAGSNFTGSALHQLRSPNALLLDSKGENLYISDNGNHRIVSWPINGSQHGTIIAGDNGQGNRTEQFGWIADMLFNRTDGSLIICDAQNKRVIRWSRRAQQGEILIGNLYCSGLAMDNDGFLYVAEYENHRISRWNFKGNRSSEIVAGGQGKGSRLNQLDQPSSIFVDENRTIFIADYSNDRIVQWNEGKSEGIFFGKIRWPKFVHLDQHRHLYSIDGYYNRVMRWLPGQINGTIVVGEQQYTLSQPSDLVFDQNGNMFISHFGAAKVERFQIDLTYCSRQKK